MRRANRRYTLPPQISPTNGQVGCNGKRQYPSQPVAARMADATRRGTGDRVQPYRCTHCRFWHVGAPALPRQHSRRPRLLEDFE